MAYTIAITGKGGTGKTSVAGLLIGRLLARDCRPILAVDADPNSCLDDVLGVKLEQSVGQIREEAKQMAGRGELTGIAKQELIQMKIEECLVEQADFDLISMGRPEGPGCYCYANHVIKEVIGQLADHYPFVVIDNEAGLENLSRRIIRSVDLMVMVSDSSKRGLETVRRLVALAREMEVEIKRLALVVNRLSREQLPESCAQMSSEIGADTTLGLPFDPTLAELAESGQPRLHLTGESTIERRLDDLLDAVLDERPPS